MIESRALIIPILLGVAFMENILQQIGDTIFVLVVSVAANDGNWTALWKVP